MDYNDLNSSIKKFEINIKKYVMFMSKNRDNNTIIKKCCLDILFAFEQIRDANKIMEDEVNFNIYIEMNKKIKMIEIEKDYVLDTNVVN